MLTHRLLAPALLPALSLAFAACGGTESSSTDEAIVDETPALAPNKISLAQWSLHKRYLPEGSFGATGEGDAYEFAEEAKAMGFDGIEYVSAIYREAWEEAEDKPAAIRATFADLHDRAEAAGIEEVLIMVDGEGELGAQDESERLAAVEAHKPYIDAAAAAGIPTIRLNAGGYGLRASASREAAHEAAVASLRTLGIYAQGKGGVNVVVENHGGYSSDPAWLRDVMAAVDMDNVGILPDFGNFCREHVRSGDYTAGCADEVPADSVYTAIGMWMPYAHAVSAKSYAFDGEGNETKIDFQRMMDTVRAHGYDGYVGIEFEGEELSEEKGITATKALLQRVGAR